MIRQERPVLKNCSLDSKGNLTVLRLSLKQKKLWHEEILSELLIVQTADLFSSAGIYTDNFIKWAEAYKGCQKRDDTDPSPRGLRAHKNNCDQRQANNDAQKFID